MVEAENRRIGRRSVKGNAGKDEERQRRNEAQGQFRRLFPLSRLRERGGVRVFIGGNLYPASFARLASAATSSRTREKGSSAARPARSGGDEAVLQRRHDGAPVGLAHAAPTGDFVARAPATDAKARARVDHADLYARRGGGVWGGIEVHPPYLGGAMADEKADEAGDFGELFAGARHIAGLPADLATGEACHRQRGGERQAAGEQDLREAEGESA